MTSVPGEDLTDSLRQWLDYIRACEAFRQRMVEYARERGLDLKGFYNAKDPLGQAQC